MATAATDRARGRVEAAGAGNDHGAVDAVADEEPGARERFVHVAAGLSVSVALIHTAAAPSHSRGYWPFVILFLLVAILQLAWGMRVWSRPGDRPLLVAGIVLNLGIVAFWAVSRTVGLPFGPDAGAAIGIHVHDLFATTGELALALAVALALRRDEARLEPFTVLIAPLWVLACLGGLVAFLGPHPVAT